MKPQMLRKISLRPSWFDHPNFNGSNPDLSAAASTFGNAFQQVIVDGGGNLSNLESNTQATNAARALVQHSIYGPWDVDNDNDGVRDSVWVEFGASVMTMPDGTLVKPLAAILCLDMDGRLNVNAHGSPELYNPWDGNQSLAGGPSNNTLSNSLPQGQGYGTADISLEPLVGANFANLLNGGTIGTKDIPGRYGWRSQRSGKSSDRPTPPVPGMCLTFKTQLSMQGVPGNYELDRQRTLPKTQFGTSPDFRARYAIGLDRFGQPIDEAWAEMNTDDTDNVTYNPGITFHVDTPYELNLFETTGSNPTETDAPYTLAELERILRMFDVDAASAPDRLAIPWRLPSRSWQEVAPIRINANLVTTDSWALPVPSGNLPRLGQ